MGPHTDGNVLATGAEDTAGSEGGQLINAAADTSSVGGLALTVLADGICEARPGTLGDGGQVLGEDGGDKAGGEESDLHFGGETDCLSELGIGRRCERNE